jgi:hypothetical protein
VQDDPLAGDLNRDAELSRALVGTDRLLDLLR